MLNEELHKELYSFLLNLTPFNYEKKTINFLTHDAFTKSKVHLKLFKEYLNDEAIYKQKVENVIYNEVVEADYTVSTDLEWLFIDASIRLYFFDKLLDKDEKKQLTINFLNVLNINENFDFDYENFKEVQNFFSNYTSIYHRELLELDNDNLRNLQVMNEVIDELNNYNTLLSAIDDSEIGLIVNPIKFYKERKEYFKDALYIESELKKNKNNITHKIIDQKLKPLEDLWLPNAKISLHNLLKIGIERKLWDNNYNIITKRNSLFGSGKSLLSSLSISLKGFAYPDTIDHKTIGSAFCSVFNISINKETKEPFKSFATGNPKYIREFKILLNFR